MDVSEAPGDEEISENSTEDTFSDGSTDGDFDTNKNISDNAATEAGSEDIQTADGSISGELPADFPKERRTAITVPKNFSFSRKTVM